MKGRGPTLPWDSPLSLFWQEGAAGNVRAHAEAIIAAAAHHMGMRFAAVQYDLIEIDQAFKMDGGFLPFLQAQPMENIGILWGSVLVSDVNWLAHGTSGTMYPGGPVVVSKARRDLAAVGRYLLANPRPPWVTDPAQPWTGFNWSKPTEAGPPPPRLDPVTYLRRCGNAAHFHGVGRHKGAFRRRSMVFSARSTIFTRISGADGVLRPTPSSPTCRCRKASCNCFTTGQEAKLAS